MASDEAKLPVQIVTVLRATRATNDAELMESWLANLGSPLTRKNFEITAERFLAALPMGIRAATVEDVREALEVITRHVSEAAGRQYVLRIKSLLGYAHRLGYAPFNAGATIKVRSDARNRGANLAKRIISEVDVALLVRGARTKRDRILLEVLYAGGLRVSELVALTWSDVLTRDKEGRVQLSIVGKGGVVRQVLLPAAVSRSLLSLRGDAGANDAVFAPARAVARLRHVRCWAQSSARQRRPVSMRRSHPTGYATPTQAMRSIATPRFPRYRRRSGMPTSRRPAAICTHAPALQAGCGSMKACFFDEGGDE